MIYDNNWLAERFNKGHKLKFLFFWGHKLAADGRITQSCFSQWWPASFTADGVNYPTAEHWMMTEKARLFEAHEVCGQILKAKSPAQAKALGRQVEKFNAAIWDDRKYEIVVKGNLLKFAQHDALKQYLLRTGQRILVEASPVDAIWGIGMAADHAQIENPLKWRGQNLLGYALMEVREKLLNDQISS